ncbi:MAG: pseudouridine synthase [Phycisphaerales bacterium]
MLDAARLGMTILRESDADAVILKPAGVASELTRDPRNESLLSRLRLSVAPGVSPKLVHRLDRVTRGVMVVAFTREAAAFHGEQIREGHWSKFYLARIPTPAPGTLAERHLVGKHKAYIDESGEPARLVRSGGKPSFLEVLAAAPAPDRPGQSHALIHLLTGRLHQIRVMMAGLGVPLCGDGTYGGRGPASDLYLEHIALWHKRADTGEIELAHLKADPQRETFGRPIANALKKVIEAPPPARAPVTPE